FSGKDGQEFALSLSIAKLEPHRVSIDVAEVAEFRFECLVGRGRARYAPAQEADAQDLPRVLSLDGERRGEEAARQAAEERTSVHKNLFLAASRRPQDGQAGRTYTNWPACGLSYVMLSC